MAPRRAVIKLASFYLRNVVGDIVLTQHCVPAGNARGRGAYFRCQFQETSCFSEHCSVCHFVLFLSCCATFHGFCTLGFSHQISESKFQQLVGLCIILIILFSTVILPCPSFCLSYRSCQPHLINLSHAFVLI